MRLISERANKRILNEELKKFNKLMEYSYYLGEADEDGDNKDDDKLLFDDEEEQDPNSQQPSGDIPTGDEQLPPPAPTQAPQQPATPAPAPAQQDSGEVELDVTDIVTGTEDAKNSADMAIQKMDALMRKFSEMESKIGNMEAIASKIDHLDKEVKKRNPTPVEKLEMRSLDSYPFNVKLTDFWESKADTYDARGGQDTNKEYKLTLQDLEDDFNETDVKNSFKVGSGYDY